MTPETPENTQARNAEAISKELRALHAEAARSFVPANMKKAAELMADFAEASVAEMAELRERSEAAEQELAAIREAE